MQLSHKQKDLTRLVLRKLIPAQILSVAIVNATSFLNSLITGNLLGAGSVAAISYIQPITLLISMLAGGICTGAQVLCGQHIGRGDAEGADRIVSISLLWSLALGAVIIACCHLFSEGIARLMGATGDDLAGATDYLMGLTWGIVFNIFSSSLLAFMQLDNCARLATVGTAALLIVNIVLDYVLIAVGGLGLYGVGLATSLGYAALMLVGIGYYFSKRCHFRIRFRGFSLPESGRIFRLGLAGMAAPLALAGRSLVLNRVCFALAGTIGVSAMGVFASLSGVVSALGGGVSGASGILASVYIGERNRHSLQELVPRAQKVALALHYAAYLVCFALAKPLAVWFGASPEGIPFITHAIRASMTCLLLNSFTQICWDMHKNLGHTALVSIGTIIDYFVCQCVFAFALKGVLGIDAVWYGSVFGEATIYVIMVIYYKRSSGKMPKLPFDYIYIPESVSAKDDDCYNASIRSIGEVETASQEVIGLCRRKGMDKRRSYFAGLCIEEQCANIIQHGFTKGQKTEDYSVELRVIIENGKAIICVRDNCVKFDPTNWCPREDNADSLKGVGIKMVQQLSEEISYRHTLGLNVLTFTI